MSESETNIFKLDTRQQRQIFEEIWQDNRCRSGCHLIRWLREPSQKSEEVTHNIHWEAGQLAQTTSTRRRYKNG